MFWSTSLSDVKKGVKNDVIVTSSGQYRVKNALFEQNQNKNRYKIAKSDWTGPQIGLKLSLIKFFKIRYRNSDLHNSIDLGGASNHDFYAKKWCS